MRKYTEWGTQTSYRNAKENGVFITTIWDEKAAEIENEAMEKAAEDAGFRRSQVRHFWAVRTGYNFYWFPDDPEPVEEMDVRSAYPKLEANTEYGKPQFRERGY